MSFNENKKARTKKSSLLKYLGLLILPVLAVCCFGFLGNFSNNVAFARSVNYEEYIPSNNLLKNGDFSEYYYSNISFDRHFINFCPYWYNYYTGASAEFNDNGVLIIHNVSNSFYITQKLENILLNSKYTLSCKINDVLYSGTITTPSEYPTSWAQFSLDFGNGIILRFRYDDTNFNGLGQGFYFDCYFGSAAIGDYQIEFFKVELGDEIYLNSYYDGYNDCINEYLIEKSIQISDYYFANGDGWRTYSYELIGSNINILSIDMTLYYSVTSGSIVSTKTFSQTSYSLPYYVVDPSGKQYIYITCSDNIITFTMCNTATVELKDISIKYEAFGYRQKDIETSYSDGYYTGYNDGYDIGNSDGFTSGKAQGVELGKTEAWNDKNTFGELMYSIIDAPFNVLSNAFNFEIFGVNISSFLIAIVSLLLVAFVLRKLL